MYCGYPWCNERNHWSHMDCNKEDCPKVPHVWDGQYTLYGPYKCSGGQLALELT